MCYNGTGLIRTLGNFTLLTGAYNIRFYTMHNVGKPADAISYDANMS